MAIIYSYPTVIPTANDLVLGTDVDQSSKPTKNFTIQSIVDIVSGGAAGLGATIKLTAPLGDASDPITGANQPIVNLSTITGSGTATFNTFTDGTLSISAGNLTTTGNGTFSNITGTLQTAAQPNITSLGILTSLRIGNAAPDVTSIKTTMVSPGSDLALVTEKAIATYVDARTANETLAETLVAGNITGGTDIAVSAGDDVTFTDTSKILMGSILADNFEIYNDTSGPHLINRSLGALQLQSSLLSVKNEGNTETLLTATDGGSVDLYFNNSKKLETTSTGVKISGALDTPVGSATAPSYTFTGDTNTGMFKSATDTVGITAGGTLGLTVNATDTNVEGNLTILGTFNALSAAQAIFGGKVTVSTPTANTDAATKGYVDSLVSGKTLDYAGTATGPFALNLATDDLEFNGDSNITVTAAAVAATKGIVTIDLNNDVGISGTMTAGTFTDGSFTGSAGTYTGYASITSTSFVGALTGNATTATELAVPGTIQLLAGSGVTQGVASNAVTYTSGGDITTLTTSLANTTVTSKTLLNLPTPTSSAIAAGDTVLEAMAKLQGQINAAGGGGSIGYEGAWRASVTAVANGALSSSTALVITTADANLVKGTVVEGAGITGTVRIDAITGTAVTLDTAITIADGITLTMSPPGGAITGATAGTAASLTTPANKVNGRFYICDTSGKAEPNAAVPWAAATTPNEWAVGDWVIYISNGAAADEWQKIDQSNEIFGSGSANKIAKWTASNTLGTGLIEDDGTTVTIGANGNLTVLGDTILGDNAAADTITLNGPTTFESTGRLKKGLALGTATDGSEYGATGQVLTASTVSGVPPTWTQPTTGTVTSVGLTETGNALTITGSPITNSGTINIAGAGAPGQYINGELNLVAFPAVDNYRNWVLAGDTGTPQTISSLDGVTFAGGFGISTVASVTDTLTTAIDITGADNAIEGLTAATAAVGDFMWFSDINDSNTIRKSTLANLPFQPTLSGTQYTIPMFATASTLGDSMITQNAGGTIATVGGELKTTTFKINNQQVLAGSKISLGTQANATGGVYSVGVGGFAGASQTAVYSVAVGAFSNGGNESNDPSGTNTAVGSFALQGITTAGENTVIGYRAGIGITTGDDNIYVGDNAGASSTTQSNEIVIGTGTSGNGSNTITIGASGHTVFFGGVNGINIGSSTKRWGDIYGALINVSGDGTFGGNVEIDGNLTVDGSIIHGNHGNGGTYNFSDTVNAGSNEDIFKIQSQHGAQAFTVYFTCNTTSMSVAKVFTVVHTYGTTVVFNKLIDSGPFGGEDFTPTFTASQDTVTCNIDNPSTSINADIVTTVVLGGSPTALTVTAL